MAKSAPVFEPRIREPELDSRVIVRCRDNNWHSAVYVGNEVFVFSDGVERSHFDVTHYIEEPSWEYVDFSKIARLRRCMTVTEKIDGANVKIEVDRRGNINVGGLGGGGGGSSITANTTGAAGGVGGTHGGGGGGGGTGCNTGTGGAGGKGGDGAIYIVSW